MSEPLHGVSKPRFEIVLSQYAFAKRTWWCLSSLLQQVDPPSFQVKLQVHVDDPYGDLNRRMIECFRSRLDLNVIEWKDERFFYRGHTRSDDLRQSSAEWLMFLDPDSILEPHFLSELARRSLDPSKVTGAPRTTMTDFEIGYCLVDAEMYDERPVEDAARKCAGVPCLSRGRRGGAGFFQLVHPETINKSGHAYSIRRRDARYDDPRGYATPSDRVLRSRVGLTVIQDLPHIYHLQHWRRMNPDCPEQYKRICH